MNIQKFLSDMIHTKWLTQLAERLKPGLNNKIMLLILAASCMADGCTKEPVVKPPVPVVTTSPKYLEIKSLSENQLQITRKGVYHYELKSTGEDPYLSLVPLAGVIHPDSVVLTFEYQCQSVINNFQIFLAPAITEARSVNTGTIAASENWATYSFDLSDQIKQFSWGGAGDFLRLDFGNQSGVTFQIRNICLRALNAAEKAERLARAEMVKNDLLLETNLKKYLSTNYSSLISEIRVNASSINIKGNFTGDGDFSLCEIRPYDHLTQIGKFPDKIPLTTTSFSVDIDRYITRNNLKYDRLLSKWVIVKNGSLTDEIVSHARYADQIVPLQSMMANQFSGKKGLGGFSVNRGFQSDLDELGISSITVNITLTSMMNTQNRDNAILHVYGDKNFYFNRAQVEELDRTMLAAHARNIAVAAIILIQKAAQCADPEIGALLQHPNYTTEGIFTMPNLTTAEGVNCYAAGLDFLARRYIHPDNAYGRIHYWILHNEVDAGLTWTNMGSKPMLVYMDTYIKSMRMCYNIVRNYDENSQVFGSFTHSWDAAVEPKYYSGKEMIETLVDYSKAEGDFQWGLACHPYPQDLFEPKTWNDANATFSMNSPLVTFKNLEVLDTWIKKPENKYLGALKRMVWLSENGTNSRTYSDLDLREQAAGFAYAWKKLKSLDGIDALQWHNWIDNRHEGGLRIGLRRFPDDASDPGGKKPVWYAYQAAGTNQEDIIFEPYKSLIGIQNWSDILHTVPIR